MKREKKKKVTTGREVKEIYPLFKWIECRCCGHEFRRESMWKVFGHTCRIGSGENMTHGHIYYEFCTKCAHTQQIAVEKTDEIYKKRNAPKGN